MSPLGFPGSSVGKDSASNAEDSSSQFYSWVGKIRWRRDRLPSSVFLGFPRGSAGKESICNVGDLGSIPGLRRPSGEGKGYPLLYSGQESSLDSIVHGVAKSQTWLSNFHFHTWNAYACTRFVKLLQSCLTLCYTMDCSSPGSSVYGILQARILELVAMPFSKGSSPSRDWTRVSSIVGRFFTIWATRVA